MSHVINNIVHLALVYVTINQQGKHHTYTFFYQTFIALASILYAAPHKKHAYYTTYLLLLLLSLSLSLSLTHTHARTHAQKTNARA